MSTGTPVSGPVQLKVYITLERLHTATIQEIANSCGLSRSSVSDAVDRLLTANKAHICDWRFETSNSSCRVIKLGRGVSVPRWKTAKGQDRVPRGDMHLLDYRQQHLAHQEFMNRFKPRPDVAAAWLFNQVQGESA